MSLAAPHTAPAASATKAPRLRRPPLRKLGELSLVARILRLVILTAGAAVLLLPYAWMISVSLKPQSEVFSTASI